MLRVVLVIAVYILAPALIITWIYKRFRSGVKLHTAEILGLIISISLVGVLMYAATDRVTDSDNIELEQIITTLVNQYDFSIKSRYQDKPAVDGVVHSKYLEIRIYGINLLLVMIVLNTINSNF